MRECLWQNSWHNPRLLTQKWRSMGANLWFPSPPVHVLNKNMRHYLIASTGKMWFIVPALCICYDIFKWWHVASLLFTNPTGSLWCGNDLSITDCTQQSSRWQRSVGLMPVLMSFRRLFRLSSYNYSRPIVTIVRSLHCNWWKWLMRYIKPYSVQPLCYFMYVNDFVAIKSYYFHAVFTRGQFWPSGIVVASVCVCVCVCPSIMSFSER